MTQDYKEKVADINKDDLSKSKIPLGKFRKVVQLFISACHHKNVSRILVCSEFQLPQN